MERMWEKINCPSQNFNNFKNTKIYVDGIQQEVKDRRIEKRTSYLLAEKISRYDESFKPINTEVQLTQGQEV